MDSNLAAVERLCSIMDECHSERAPHKRLITFVVDRPGHDRRYAIDASKLKTEWGGAQPNPSKLGLTKTVHWYLENRAWWEPLRGRFSGERQGLLEPPLTASCPA